MAKLDHLTLPVKHCSQSRDWYLAHLGLKVEFEVPERSTVALQDDSGFTMFLVEAPAESFTASCTLTFQVDDVETTHRALTARGVIFDKSPQKLFWGYGAELRDPDGYLIYLWDERSMQARG